MTDVPEPRDSAGPRTWLVCAIIMLGVASVFAEEPRAWSIALGAVCALGALAMVLAAARRGIARLGLFTTGIAAFTALGAGLLMTSMVFSLLVWPQASTFQRCTREALTTDAALSCQNEFQDAIFTRFGVPAPERPKG